MKMLSKLKYALSLQVFIFNGILVMTQSVFADMPPRPTQLWENKQTVNDAQVVLDARSNPNKYCTQCHESGNATGRSFSHAGKHFQADVKSPNTGEQITCVSCHGNMSENHRKGVKDVMRFNAHGKASNPALERTVNEQNQVCVACHSPEKLREKFWAHDTHVTKISCTNCHELHPEKDPMKGIAEKDRIKLCVNCHTKVRNGEFKASEVVVPESKENK